MGENHKTLNTAIELVEDIINTKVGEEIAFDFKDEKMVFKRME